MFYRHGDRIHFLDKLGSDVLDNRAAAGTRHKDTDIFLLYLGELIPDGNQELQYLFSLLRVVALIV